jgi:hypothetical protein
LTYFYPETEVNVGDSWTTEFSGELSSNNIWTLLESDNEQELRISGESEVNFDTVGDTIEMNLVGTMLVEITADSKNGFLKQMHVESEVQGSSELLQFPDKPFPTTVETTTDYRVEVLK